MLTISIGQTIRTTDPWLTAVPSDGWYTYNNTIVRGEMLPVENLLRFELVVVNERGVASEPAFVDVYVYRSDDGPGGPGGKTDPSETPPIIVQPETM